jgi:hypothetical protein
LRQEFPLPREVQSRGYVLTGFIDPGGSIDDYFFTVLKTDIPTAKIQVYGAMHWLLDEKRGIDFAKIRNDIAKLHLRNHFNLIGCELNNFGRGEVQQMRREYHINMYGVNTSGKVTSEQIIKKAHTLDKHQMVKWTNSWRADGNITFPTKSKQTPEIKKIVHQLDSFVVKKTDGSGGPSFKYAAEGTQHDDGIMSLLGNLYIVKEKFLKISGYGLRTTGGKSPTVETIDDRMEAEEIATPGRTLGSINTTSVYDNL